MGKKAVETETDTGTQVAKPPGEVLDEAAAKAAAEAEAKPDELAKVKAEADGQRAALEAERAKRQTAEAELEQLRAAESAAAAEAEVTSVLDGLEAKPMEEQLATAVEALRELSGEVQQLKGDARVGIIRDQYAGHTKAVAESGLEDYGPEQRDLDVAYLKERGMPSLAEAFYSRNREALLGQAKAEGEKAGLEAHQLNKETGAEGVSGTAPPAEPLSPEKKA
ncbi:hypothetical protein LCGC14_3047650, partial [marine sediment metagenome]